MWQIEKRELGLTRYKYGKIADSLGRRMRLKVDKVASRTVYLNKDTFEEVRYNQKKLTPNLSELKMTVATTFYDATPMPDQSMTNLDFSTSMMGQVPSMNLGQETKTSQASNSPERHRKETIDFYEERPEKLVEEVKEDSLSESDLKQTEPGNFSKTTSADATPSQKKRREKKDAKIFECERITVRGAIWGEIEMSEKENYFTFRPLPGERPEGELYELGTMKHNFITSTKKKSWNYQKIRQIHQRRYNYMKCAFEIFTNDNKSYYFNVFSNSYLKAILSEFKLRNKDIQICSKETFMETDIQKRWIEGKISNFEYLIQVNMYAGRSFNDLSQYPVFPWVIADYRCEELNLNTRDEAEQKRIFRDLSLPIGAMTEEKRRELKRRVLDMMDMSEEEVDMMDKEKLDQRLKAALAEEDIFMFGSHYSTGGHIMDYLVRLEPFTSLQIKLQSGKFDEVNRIFASIPKAWEAYRLSHNTQNFKELVPEFFYCPNFLKNR